MAKRPPGLVYDDADLDAVVRTMLGEAAGEGDDGLAAVAHVIVNRLENGGYGGSLYKVAHAPKQFSAWNSSGSGGNSLVDLPEDDPRYIEARAIAEEVLNGRHEDNTGGAVNYFAPKGMTGKNGTKKGDPDWASRMSYTTTIGGHKFYSDGSAAAAAENLANGGDDVASLQQQLAARGFDPGAIDGVKGPRTTAAIKAFQKANGLEADGIVGPRTLAALNSQREPGSLETALSGMGVPAAFGVRGNSGATSPDEIARTPDGFTAAAPGDVRDDARLITLGRPAGSVDPVGAGPRLGDLLRMRSAIPAPVTEADTRAEQRTLGTGSPAGPVLGFKPFAAPAPLTAPAMDDTGYRPTFGGVQQLGVTPTAPDTPTAPTTPPSPTGGGFDLGSMLGGLGNTLGQTAQNVGKTLGTTATNVVEGTKAGLEKTAESVKDTLTNELIGTVKGRTLLMNTALGIQPRRDPAAERRISAPEGFAYGATGKKLYKIGQTYNSSRGQVVFDGSKFVPAGTQVRSSVDIPGRPAMSTKPRETFQSVWDEARG